MYLSTEKTLEENAAFFISVPAIGTCHEEFNVIIERIKVLGQTQETKNGFAKSRTTALNNLGDAAHEIAGAVHAFAVETGDETLAARVNFSRTAITAGRDSSVLSRCREIQTAASQNLAALTDYPITATDVNGLKKKADAFEKLQVKPRQGTAVSKAATSQLPGLFRKATTLLNGRLDRLMVRFKKSNPDFYNEYQTARAIVDNRGGRGSKVATTAKLNPTSSSNLKAA